MTYASSLRAVVLGAPFALFLAPALAHAGDGAPAASATSTASTASTSAPAAAPSGVAVLAAGSAGPLAWPLAQTIYGTASLRPASLDEPTARVLAGEPPPPSAPAALRDMAEMRAGVKGDDAPSRAMLASIARASNVRAVVVVDANEGQSPSARVFLADTSAFDAARYAPDPGPALAWDGAVASLTRAFGRAPHVSAPALAVSALPAASTAPPMSAGVVPRSKPGASEAAASRPFYASPWFWGALGAAAIGVGAVYFATRDNGSDTIHLQVQVPK